MSQSTTLDRRALLRAFAVSPMALAGMSTWSMRAMAQEAGLIAPNVCMLSAEVTEGPYYIDPDLVRADITEDREGLPLHLRMQVVTADCQPVEGARVDVWHCDAAGNYSGFAGQGSDAVADTSSETFLRGTQFTDAAGLVGFDTIYPGWYRGRTTHIHYKVFLDEKTVLTSQIFFPDALSAYLFQSVPPYNDRDRPRDTVNSTDGIAKQAGDGAYAAIREQPDRYEADLVVGFNPQAESLDAMMPGGARPGGPAGGPPREGAPDGAAASAATGLLVPPLRD